MGAAWRPSCSHRRPSLAEARVLGRSGCRSRRANLRRARRRRALSARGRSGMLGRVHEVGGALDPADDLEYGAVVRRLLTAAFGGHRDRLLDHDYRQLIGLVRPQALEVGVVQIVDPAQERLGYARELANVAAAVLVQLHHDPDTGLVRRRRPDRGLAIGKTGHAEAGRAPSTKLDEAGLDVREIEDRLELACDLGDLALAIDPIDSLYAAAAAVVLDDRHDLAAVRGFVIDSKCHVPFSVY